jgi:hypothetical protein
MHGVNLLRSPLLAAAVPAIISSFQHRQSRDGLMATLGAIILAGGTLASATASGTTITFGGLTGANGAPVAQYSEGGFTVTTTVGQWFEGQLFGNPVPSIFAGPIGGGPANNAIAVTDSVLPFTFSAVDLATANANTTYTFTGLLAGIPQFVIPGIVVAPPQVFNTVPSGVSGVVIDTLLLTASIGAGGTSTNIDNIVVSKVPGPIVGAGLPGLILACGALLALVRRRRQLVA